MSNPLILPDELLGLKNSAELETVSLSQLARRGTAVLQQILASAEPVAITVQGQGTMVTVSKNQYDQIVALITQLSQTQPDSDVMYVLSQRFDELVARMNQPGASQVMEAALFADPEKLNESYRPGSTEDRD